MIRRLSFVILAPSLWLVTCSLKKPQASAVLN